MKNLRRGGCTCVAFVHSLVFVPAFHLGGVAGTAALEELEKIVLLTPRQDGTKQGRRCSHSAIYLLHLLCCALHHIMSCGIVGINTTFHVKPERDEIETSNEGFLYDCVTKVEVLAFVAKAKNMPKKIRARFLIDISCLRGWRISERVPLGA